MSDLNLLVLYIGQNSWITRVLDAGDKKPNMAAPSSCPRHSGKMFDPLTL